MSRKLTGFVVCALLSLCDSSYVDTIKKCSFKDDKCVGNIVQTVLKDVGQTGIPEFDLVPFDPMDISGLSIPISGLVNILIEEGSLMGVKDCEVKHYHNDYDGPVTDVDLLCDFTIKAKFKLADMAPFIQQLFGSNAVAGYGNMIMKIDRMRMKLKFFYDIVKKTDGDIYFIIRKDGLTVNFKIGNVKITADNIFFGGQDLSGFVEKIFNENWKTLLPVSGSSISQVVATIIKNTVGNFFGNVPSKYYYIEDITPYLTISET